MTYPQPMEGVLGELGRDLTDNDLLSLEMSATLHREMIKGLALHLHSATLVGNAPAKVQRMFERIKHPQIGDYVVELSTRFRGDLDIQTKGFGILICHRREWWQTDEKYQADIAAGEQLAEDERSTDEAWYVQYGQDPEDICRWTNAMFIAVPLPDEAFSPPIGKADGWITRDTLLGGLADSGFHLS